MRPRWPTISPAQLALAVVDPAQRMIGQYLIDLVDEAGYLNGDLALVAEKLGAPAAEVDAVLAILQGFDIRSAESARDAPRIRSQFELSKFMQILTK